MAIGRRDAPRLWQAGVETPISVEDAQAYERWIVWMCDDLEKRIIAALAG